MWVRGLSVRVDVRRGSLTLTNQAQLGRVQAPAGDVSREDTGRMSPPEVGPAAMAGRSATSPQRPADLLHTPTAL